MESAGKRKVAAVSRREIPDAELCLLRAAAQGDQTSCERLYNAHVSTVLRTIFHKIHNQATAEDLTQETFRRFFRYLPGFRGDCSTATHLYEIARQCVARWCRTQVAHPDFAGESLTTLNDRPYLVPPPSHGYDDREKSNELDHFLPYLSEQQRTVIIYTREGRTDQEIAGIMDISIRSVRVHRFRAKSHLRRLINEASK